MFYDPSFSFIPLVSVSGTDLLVMRWHMYCPTLLFLLFRSGPSPEYSKGTYIPVFPTGKRQSNWPGRITNTSGNTVTMGITAKADCIVGKYHLYVAVMTPFGIRRTRKDDSRSLYILFNPWAAGQLTGSFLLLCQWAVCDKWLCVFPADAVFLDDETERQECVLNEIGIIYHGAFDDIAERNWNYGQVTKPLMGNRRDTLGSYFSLFILKPALYFPPSSTMAFWMPACTSWTGPRCLSPTEGTPSRWPE